MVELGGVCGVCVGGGGEGECVCEYEHNSINLDIFMLTNFRRNDPVPR